MMQKICTFVVLNVLISSRWNAPPSLPIGGFFLLIEALHSIS